MLKILQARLQQYMTCKLPDVQAGFRKDRGTRDPIAHMHACLFPGLRNRDDTQVFENRDDTQVIFIP